DGQPFEPAIIDAPGPGFGDAYFMLKSTYPMLWELGSDISSSAVDRDTFIISDNATFRGTRFFTFLYPQIGATGATSAGDIIVMHNPNPFPATVTLSRWTGVLPAGPGATNVYTPLITQVIDPNSAWETGGSMDWEFPGVQGTDPTHSTHYRI